MEFFDTGWGEGAVFVLGGRLVAVDLPGPGLNMDPGIVSRAAAQEDREAAFRWAAELEAYFRGERLSWTAAEVCLEALGLGPFELRVCETLLTVPAGATISYAGLAELAGFPRAARAVGNAMANNPIPIVVPCHRVIYSDGRLGHYGEDDEWKQRLLAHEEKHAARRSVSKGTP